MIDLCKRRARVLAYYLPQFHPIPENDQWWGKGFTEWTNVGSAVPLFKGHQQPRIPTDLGYYDLRIPEVREEQANLARNAGVEGFIYWHYYFGGGKRLLEMPITEVLKTGKPDFPFCLAWANHSWSSQSWDRIKSKKDDQLLMKQEYLGEKDNIEHFYTLLPAFSDKRYIQINNKPVFLIYDGLGIPQVEEFLELWNNLAIKNGLNGIYFIARNGGSSSSIDTLLNLGFDAVNRHGQFEAENQVKGKVFRSLRWRAIEKIRGRVLDVYDYHDIIKNIFNEYDSRPNVIPTIIPQWDRSPRRQSAIIYKKSSPEIFSQHLQNALDIISRKEENARILILKSWNEWGEGNYMEPDKYNGHGYLNALKEKIFY